MAGFMEEMPDEFRAGKGGDPSLLPGMAPAPAGTTGPVFDDSQFLGQGAGEMIPRNDSMLARNRNPAAPLPPEVPQADAAGGMNPALAALLQTAMGAAPQAPQGPALLGYGGVQKDMAAASQTQMDGARKAADAAANVEIAKADAAQKVASFQEQQAAQQRQAEAQRAAQLQKIQGDYDAAAREVAKPPPDVNPNRWWGSRSTAQKVTAGVAVALSGIGAGLIRRGQASNGALDMINRFIAEDVDAQKANIEKDMRAKSMNLSAMQSLYSMNLSRFGDARAAEAATRGMLLEKVRAETEAKIARSGSDVVRANGELLVGQIQQQAAQSRLSLTQAMNDSLVKKGTLDLQRHEIDSKNAASQRQAIAMAVRGDVGAGTDPSQLTEDERERFVPGYGLALTKDAAKEARKMAGDYEKARGTIRKLIEYRKEYGSETLPTAAKSAMRVLAKELELDLKNSNTLGTLDKGSQEFLADMTGGDPTAYGFDKIDRWEAIGSSMDNGFSARLSKQMETQAGVGAAPSGFVSR